MILIHVKFKISCPADDRGKFCQQRIFINSNPTATFNEKTFISEYDENHLCQWFIQINGGKKNTIQKNKSRIQSVVNYGSLSHTNIILYFWITEKGRLKGRDWFSVLLFFQKQNKSQWSSFILNFFSCRQWWYTLHENRIILILLLSISSTN